MDIVVTTPLSERANAAREAAALITAGGGQYFRALHAKPARLTEGDRIFYVEAGYVRGYGVVAAVHFGGDRCGITERWWDGAVSVWFDARSWTWIRPLPMQGFQGFRYATRDLLDLVEVVGGWLDTMPEAP